MSILFIDLETSGLPDKTANNIDISANDEDEIDIRLLSSYDNYPSFVNNYGYSTSRILQIGWCLIKNNDLNVDLSEIKSVYRKPDDFKEISKSSIDIHGITIDIVNKNGLLLKDILDGDFGKCILDCDYIMAYNIAFDFSILINECYRLNHKTILNKLLELKQSKKAICVFELSKKIFNKSYKLSKLYEIIYGNIPIGIHDAKNDVYIMIMVYKELLNKKNLSLTNKHNKNKYWTSDEETLLTDNYYKKTEIAEIAKIHKRTECAILSRLKKLGLISYDVKTGKYIDQILQKSK